MKSTIWSIVLMGLILCGCSKDTKKIYEPIPQLKDVTPPKVEITSPKDGEIFYLNPYCCGIPRVYVALQFTIRDKDGLIKSIYVNGEKQNHNDLATGEYEGFVGYVYTAEHQIQYTVEAYDHAGNIGRDSVRIYVKRSE